LEYVINFRDDNEDDVRSSWPGLFRRSEMSVKAARSSRGRVDRWWLFPIPGFYRSYGCAERQVLAAAVYARHLIWSFVPGSVCLNSKVFVCDAASSTLFAALQSRVHTVWAWTHSSTLKMDLAYSAQDAFQTFPFPFPQPDPRTIIPTLETIGRELYDARTRFMVETNQGLTKTYNAIKDQACDDRGVVELRRLHETMDRAVLDAYGWSDVAVPPYCPATDADRAAVQAFEDEVIDRLHVLNAERAKEEERLGLGGKRGKKAQVRDATEPAKKRGNKAKGGTHENGATKEGGQRSLF
jgi:hypothetical protein